MHELHWHWRWLTSGVGGNLRWFKSESIRVVRLGDEEGCLRQQLCRDDDLLHAPPFTLGCTVSMLSSQDTHSAARTQTSLHMYCKFFKKKTICDKNNPNKITDQFIIMLQHERIMPQYQLHDLHKVNQIWIMCKTVQYPSVQHLKKTFFTPVDGIFISNFVPCTSFHLSVPIKTHSYTLYFVSHFPLLLLYHPGRWLQCVCVSVNVCIWWSEWSHLVFQSIRCWYLSAVIRLAICTNTLFSSTSAHSEPSLICIQN